MSHAADAEVDTFLLNSINTKPPSAQTSSLASPGSPLPFVGDQTLPAEGNLRDQAQTTSVTDQQWEMPTSFGLGSVDPETNDEM